MLFTTTLVWSEPLVSVTFLAALLAMLRFEERPVAGRGAAVVALAGAGFAAHNRLLPMTVVAVALVAVEVVSADGSPSAPVLASLPRPDGHRSGFVAAYSAWLVDASGSTPRETNTVGGVLARLADPGCRIALLAARPGLVPARHHRRAGRSRCHRPRGRARRSPIVARPAAAPARIVLAATGSLAAVSIVFMSDRLRPDQIVYGRYNDAVLGPVVLVGIGALVSIRGRALALSCAVVAGCTAATVGAVLAWRDEALAANGAVRTMVLGLHGFQGRARTIDVVVITALALAALAVLAIAAALARWSDRRSLAILALLPLVAVGYVEDRGRSSTTSSTRGRCRRHRCAGWTTSCRPVNRCASAWPRLVRRPCRGLTSACAPCCTSSICLITRCPSTGRAPAGWAVTCSPRWAIPTLRRRRRGGLARPHRRHRLVAGRPATASA